MKRYDVELIVEIVSEAISAGRLKGLAGRGALKQAEDYPIVISYHYGCGMSPYLITVEEAEELLKELEATLRRVRKAVS